MSTNIRTNSEPEWWRPVQVLARLGQWEPVIRELLRWDHRSPDKSNTWVRRHWREVLPEGCEYWAWLEEVGGGWERINREVREEVEREHDAHQ